MRGFHPGGWAQRHAQQSVIHPYPMVCYHYATWMIWIGSSSCSSSSQCKNPTKQTESQAPNNQKESSRDRTRLGSSSDGVTVVGNLFSLPNFTLPQNYGRDAAPLRSPAPCSSVCASALSNSLCMGRIRCWVEF